MGFAEDAGEVGSGVAQYLTGGLEGGSFCEIDPAGFFSLGGISVRDNVALFPEDKFYSLSRQDLVVFTGSEPRLERPGFLQAVLDVAERCGVVEICTVSGLMSSMAHTAPRRVLAVFNKPELREKLRGHELDYMTWEGQPALNSFLLWSAGRRDIPGVSLWLTVPFYLAAAGDPAARKKALEFLDARFDLGLDLSDISEEAARQDQRLAELRIRSPEVDGCIEKLEKDLAVTQEEGQRLAGDVAEFLRSGY